MIPTKEAIELTVAKGAKKSSKKYMWIATVLVLVFGTAAYYKFYNSKSALSYLSVPVELKDITTTVSATGNLEPTNSVDVGIEVSGTIREVLVDYNTHVKVSQVMAKLDTTRLNSAVESSKAALSRYRANVAEAKATVVYAQGEFERVDKMYSATNGNYPSAREVDEAKASMDRAKAAYDATIAQTKQASAELAANEDNLRKAIVLSPIDGIVLERKVEPGQTVAATMQTPILFKMAEDLTKMRIILSVDEADIGDVKESQSVEFSVAAYSDKKFKGTITQLRLNSEIINGVVTYDAVVDVNNQDLLLRPGMTVSALITTSILEDVLTVPNAALRFTPPEQSDSQKKAKEALQTLHVWILKDNKPHEVELKVGKSDGSSTVVLSSDLKVGDSVIIGIKK
ncbi:Secretion protein HlyD [Sulfurimonas denitrificans DSM 1251]|jgi:HlyD family secretion protein|uniref:Secretion protein HlyD n=1 Tax=Sulfurimonas denitrificans (strain ATCC 33889 / DSM 1251) TaxID=326298 RepID=Q30NW6_SULDN|nr:efflux RND transporter periplasmic adaptor subunit [Sulfurimonas denitrificans]ABB45315.1 Secretion protein HlyD [Sulfurimonas denitrificans DSM 1251]MDD3442114.1 efflux RND transporter periplasmic adaptor subunit [Sulfurimonas denitrificans]